MYYVDNNATQDDKFYIYLIIFENYYLQQEWCRKIES